MKQNLLNSIKLSKPGKNVFDLTHDVKLSCNWGELVPVLCMECLPNETHRIEPEALTRLAPMVAPVMHRMNQTFHQFFVPCRILWPDFENYIRAIQDGSTVPARPYITVAANGTNYTRLMDFMGIPNPTLNPGAVSPESIDAMPFAAYQMIFNEYYRDQNMVNPINFQCVNGDNTGNDELTAIRKRAWEHDYFTSALPTPQAGPAVTLPLVADFPDVEVYNTQVDPVVDLTTSDPLVDINVPFNTSDDPITSELYASTSDLSGDLGVTTINDLRTAFRLQEWFEKAMRGGRRLFETILVRWGIKSPDQRLQRPEYITGTMSPIVVSEVLQTSSTDATTPQANMAGHGVGITGGKSGNYFCQEWGYFIVMMSITPKTAYMQGIPKMFQKYQDPYAMFWPEFQNLGEQAVLIKELYAFGPNNTSQWGYMPRYAEYKFLNSRVCGEFRSSLDFWHLGRKFTAEPGLNQDFIECNPRYDIFAVEDPNVDHFYMHVLLKITSTRAMAKYGTPTF